MSVLIKALQRKEQKMSNEKGKIDGYEEARCIEKEINDLLEKYPIEDNGQEWWRLTRTLNTTLSILEEKAKEDISRQTRIMIGWDADGKNLPRPDGRKNAGEQAQRL